MTHILNDYEIDKIREEMCDNYCQMPHFYSEVSLMDICEGCPMNRLVEDGTSDDVI